MNGFGDLKRLLISEVMDLHAGHAAVSHLSENGAVSMLLNVLKDHDTSLSPVTELAVKALVKFMDEPNGKKAFLNGGGIKSLVAVLKLDATGTSDVKSITTIILVSYPHHWILVWEINPESCLSLIPCFWALAFGPCSNEFCTDR